LGRTLNQILYFVIFPLAGHSIDHVLQLIFENRDHDETMIDTVEASYYWMHTLKL